jgi:hypothetical protein
MYRTFGAWWSVHRGPSLAILPDAYGSSSIWSRIAAV